MGRETTYSRWSLQRVGPLVSVWWVYCMRWFIPCVCGGCAHARVCVFVCVVCVSACACARVCVCTRARMHTCMHTCGWVLKYCAFTCVHTFTVQIDLCSVCFHSVCMYCECVRACVCVCVLCACVQMYMVSYGLPSIYFVSMCLQTWKWLPMLTEPACALLCC